VRTRKLVLFLSVFVVFTLVTVCVQSGSPVLAEPLAVPARSTRTQKTKLKSKATTRTSARKSGPRARRMQRAVSDSKGLQPLAQRLLDKPSPGNYAAVEGYARAHASQTSGALAWLAAGYSHYKAGEFDKAVSDLKRAQPHAGEVGDYAAYFLGSSYMSLGDTGNATATFQRFEDNYPGSLFLRDAMLDYGRALTSEGEYHKAVLVLGRYRDPIRADVEMTLARAMLQDGKTSDAVRILQNLYYTMPLADEAAAAGEILKTTPDVPQASLAERRKRADLLARGGRYDQAISEYRDLETGSGAEARNDLELAIGRTLERSGRDDDARSTLEPLALSAAQNPERLYYLIEIARSDRDEDRLNTLMQQLRESAPTSRWLERALLSAGNMYLLKPDYDRAIDFYRELRDRFPGDDLAAYSGWKAAWLTLRQGRDKEAAEDMEKLIARYPDSAHVSNAVYWRGRLAEEEGDSGRAWTWYQKLLDRFPNYYYADRARERMARLVRPAALVSDPLLEKIPAISLPARHLEIPDPPASDVRYQKARLLENAALYEFAAGELESASEQGADWAASALADMYNRGGLYYEALRTMKRTVPSYFSVDLDALPRPYWEGLFPRAYWDDLERFARNNKLDPFLVASLIRQESEFNPAAVSPARALGLMQLMPSTGKAVARQMGVRFSKDELLSPTFNLRLGMRHFRELLDHFDGHVEYALAAYNAGADRVDSWLQQGPYRDSAEFVESIPFTETREYVQAIMRNASVYRKLYENTRTADANAGTVGRRSAN
jgi:soluble lytic murein transglycosylase